MNPAQQVIKIVHEELIATLGEAEPLNLSGQKPWVVILVGLQGSGKTTASAKLAKSLRAKGERVMLVAADPYRPAAVKQLQTLGEQIGVPVHYEENVPPPKLVERAYHLAQKGGISVVVVDTAGRSQLDQGLMEELQAISKKVVPNEVLLVVDAMIGQEALHVAEGFRDALSISGLILTKMDGDARGGAAISVRSVTGVPIKFLGTGEKLDSLEFYDSGRLATRVLGMGDMIGLIEKAEQAFDETTARENADKMFSGQFTLEDFADQIKQVKKMGPLSQILDMMPGNVSQMAGKVSVDGAEKQLKTTEAIISSMTLEERRNPKVLNASRRRRIARGSGTEVQDVNRLLKQFRETQKLLKQLSKTGKRGLPRFLG